jgi:tRNA A-37 threonylcarbamoyl transferase component Bud32
LTELITRIQAALGDAFHVERELGGGGMSRLFLATEASLNRKVVIKLLPPDLASEVSAARFKQEMEFAAHLQHPHILPILAAGAREGLLYYIMPYVAGESLRGRLEREGRLSVADATRLLTEVADALAFAHGKGIIHRDIKPENVLLEGKHAVLADFGIARALLESRTGRPLTVTGTSVGTPGYMAPEQLSGEFVDARADVYALAVVGYEMLAGAPPFTGPSAQAILTAHLTTPPSPVHSLRPDVPISLSAALSRALAKEPGERFASAMEFADAVAAAEPASKAPIETRQPGRLRRWILLAAVLTGLAVIGTLLTRAQASRRRDSDLLVRLTPAADSGRLDEVAEILAGAGIPPDAQLLKGLTPRVAGHLSVASDPPGAAVTLTRVTPFESFPGRTARAVGTTPLTVPLVAGEYLVHLEARGRRSLDFLTMLAPAETTSVERVLLADDSATAGMLFVGAGSTLGDVRVEAFLMDRHEVTNAEFLQFVGAGGYRDAALWPDSLIVGGQHLRRDDALRRFVDRTGLPGPRGWENGRPPEGRSDHPVAGVTWYEAAAYAQWAGKTLPTSSQWWRAAVGDGSGPYPWGGDAASTEIRTNFGLAGTAAVGTHPLGVSPWGVQDLPGNVREWLLDLRPSDNRRVAVGGSWQDPSYMFEQSKAEFFEPGFASDLLGIRLVRTLPPTPR